MRVHQERVGQLGRRARELGQHQCSVEVVPGGDVLLAHQVHPVPQRRDHHDVGRAVQRDELLTVHRLVQVVDDRAADPAELAVEPSHLLLDVAPHHLVLVDTLPARRRQLDHGHRLRVHPARDQQLAQGPQPHVDALGVVEPVHSQQHPVRVPQVRTDLLGTLDSAGLPCKLAEGRGVDGDREGSDLDLAAVVRYGPGVAPDLHSRLRRFQAQQFAGQPQEVLCPAGHLEADHVGAQQTPYDLAAPRQLHEQLDRRKRNVQEETDTQIRTLLAKHGRHQLKLVVLHPHRRPRRRRGSGGVSEAPIHRDMAVPPSPLEHRRHHDIVIQRPQRGVGEPLVVVPHLGRGQTHRVHHQAVVVERGHIQIGLTGPADPGALTAAQKRLQRTDQTTRTRTPPLSPVLKPLQINRQPIGDHQKIRGTHCRHPHSQTPLILSTRSRSLCDTRVQHSRPRCATDRRLGRSTTVGNGALRPESLVSSIYSDGGLRGCFAGASSFPPLTSPTPALDTTSRHYSGPPSARAEEFKTCKERHSGPGISGPVLFPRLANRM